VIPGFPDTLQNGDNHKVAGRIAVWATRLAIAGAVLYVLVYLVVALLRIDYPFELEWMEGSMVDHVARVANGLPLYVRPSLDFIPTMYTPLYYFVSALVAKVVGLGFFPLRLVSFLSSLGCFAAIYYIVRRETGKQQSAMIAVGLFAGTYVITGTFFDLARVDSFAAFLLFLGAALVHRADSPLRLVSAAIILSLAFFAKQSALPAIGLLTCFAIYSVRLRSVWLIVPLIVLIGGGSAWINQTTDGWFRYYVLDLPRHHRFLNSAIKDFWYSNLIKHVPILLICGALYLVIAFKAQRKSFWYAICLLAGFTIISFLGKSKIGGYSNNLIPIYGALAICTGFLIGAIDRKTLLRLSKGTLTAALTTALVLQFVRLWYNPIHLVPTHEMRTAGEEFVIRLSQNPGRLYIPCHGYLATIAGKPAMAHQQALVDLASADSSAAQQLEADLTLRLRSKDFGLIVLDTLWQSPILEEYYTLSANSLGDSVIYHAWMEGEQFRPRYWYLPKH
jgi:hypothetical protein